MSNGLYIGLMSGTSADGIDAALVELSTSSSINCVSSLTTKYDSDLRTRLVRLNSEPHIRLDDFIRLDNRVAAAFADAVEQLLQHASIKPGDVIAIGSHGQTIFHLPDDAHPGTLQIGNPSIIAARTGIDTIGDFRRADMAHGGQGAPLAPAFHASTLLGIGPTVVVNLGGIANITILTGGDSGRVSGFDTGPANTLMDNWCQQHRDLPYDKDGAWARSGVCDPQLLHSMLGDPFFHAAPPKTTGLDHFNRHWLDAHLAHTTLPPANVQATLLELTATTITNEISVLDPLPDDVLLCGGGAHNSYLVQRIEALIDRRCSVGLTADRGIDVDYCEALAFAWLAYRHKSKMTGNLISVTGASQPAILGGFYPATPS